MELNQIFKIDNYSEAVKYADENNYRIVELKPDNNGNRQFKIVKMQINEKELIENEMYDLKSWYNTYYTEHEQKFRRLHTLGKLTDEGKDPYNELINLYNEAEIKRARIQELERLLSDGSK